MDNTAAEQELTASRPHQSSNETPDSAFAEESLVESAANAIRNNPVAALAIGAAIFALARTPAGKVIRPALRLAISSGAASAMATAVAKQFTNKH